MGELIPFRAPGAEARVASVKLSETAVQAYVECMRIRAGTHVGHAICGPGGNILRLIATAPDEILSDETKQELLERYSSEGSPAEYAYNPPAESVQAYQSELGFFVDL